ncbi:sulfatase family protein [Ramlibacter albus]|uniref:Sulfatase n=1 Tax=Ramlibacter albus TaxID=2079448 RepID=A0A923MCF3_9BURK|nr:sulfatase [Ramlibacter albus]MBC5766754.1 sulfatase [Ramlibacter albus]
MSSHASNRSRRHFIRDGAAAAAAAATFGIPAAGAQRPAGLPNILCFVSEDNFPVIGAYGDSLVHTPTIDRLARQGVMYDRVYCASPVCGPSRFSIITGMYPEAAGSAAEFGSTDEVLPAYMEGYAATLRRAGYYCTNNQKKNYNSQLDYVDMWDESSTKAHWRTKPAGKPFLAIFNTFTTHESALFQPLTGKVKPEDVPIPPYLPDMPGVRKDFATFYNAMEKMDGEFAARLAEVEKAGLADDTIVFYYSDNGGITPRGKRFCYELGTRCALVIYVPPKWAHLMPHAPGSVVKQPTCFVDIAPTLLSIAGIAPPRHMHGRALMGKYYKAPAKYVFSGRDRMDERYDLTRSVTDGRWRYIRNYAPHRIYGQHVGFMFQAAGYQDWEAAHRAGTLNVVQERFWQTKPHEELYDTFEDFHQIQNLADRPEVSAKLEELRRALDDHMIAVNDNAFIPEGSSLLGYTRSREPNAYPLRALMKLAAKAAQGDPRNLAEFQRLLRHDHECMRYWAAQGLLILDAKAQPALDDMKAALGRESSVPVRIVLAELLVRLANDRDALRQLGTVLDYEPKGVFRLQALNALTYVAERAGPIRPAIVRSAADQHRHVMRAAEHLLQVMDRSYDPYKVSRFAGGGVRYDPEVPANPPTRPYD